MHGLVGLGLTGRMASLAAPWVFLIEPVKDKFLLPLDGRRRLARNVVDDA